MHIGLGKRCLVICLTQRPHHRRHRQRKGEEGEGPHLRGNIGQMPSRTLSPSSCVDVRPGFQSHLRGKLYQKGYSKMESSTKQRLCPWHKMQGCPLNTSPVAVDEDGENVTFPGAFFERAE